MGKADFATPIRNQYARAEENYGRSFNNPLGAYTTADQRDKSKREHGDEMQQHLGMDLADAAMQNQQNSFNQQSVLASLTQPRFYNQSSTSSSPFTGGDAIGLGASVGSSLLS